MQTLLKKFRSSRWLWLLMLGLMFCVSGGCALFDPEPQKVETVGQFMKQKRPSASKAND